MLQRVLRYCAIAAIAGATALTYAPPRASAILYQTGDVFASVGNGNVNHFNSAGTLLETLNIGASGFTTGSAFDGAGNLYVTGFSVNRVAKFDNSGNLVNSTFITTGLSTPESIVFDKSGNIFVGNLNSGIQKYDAAGAFLGNVINTRVDWFDLTADQSTFRFGQEGSVVKTVSNALPGTPGPDFASGLSNAFAMRILADGGLLVADNGDIKRFNSAGALIQSYDIAGVNGWFALNLDPDGTSFWSGSFGDGILRKFDIASGTLLQSINSGGGSSLFGVSVFGEITAGGPPTNGGPVPEPSGLLLFSIGLLGLGIAAHRRRKIT